MAEDKNLKVVSDKTQVKVGKFYDVLCAVLINKKKEHYVPVIGILHKDPQFGVDAAHYHIDGRFTVDSAAVSKFLKIKDGITNAIIRIERYCDYQFVRTEVKNLKCRRLLTGINPPARDDRYNSGQLKGEAYWKWYDSMIGKSCKGKKCPHFGTHMQEKDGVLVCPLHNLHGSIETELIIKEI